MNQMIPPHEITSPAKVVVLAAHIKRHGWQGAPLVADGLALITGTHRYAAATLIGYGDDEIPTIDIRDLFADNGLDYSSFVDEENGYDLAELAYVLPELPSEVRAAYGIDWE